MTEQFPTLGNWLARMSKKQAAKSKFKSQSGITLPNTSTAEVAHVNIFLSIIIICRLISPVMINQ